MSTSTGERCVALDELGVEISDQAQQSGQASWDLYTQNDVWQMGARGVKWLEAWVPLREQVMFGKGLQHL